jgi:RNA polymerase sigma factor (sigma-70 family)
MSEGVPLDLAGLLRASDARARDEAWAEFLATHTRLLVHTARSVTDSYDAAMDAYTYLVEQLRSDDYRRLRAYNPDGRSKFTTWLVVVARRLCLDWHRQRYGRARESTQPRRDARALRRRIVDLVVDDVDPARAAAPEDGRPDAALESEELAGALESALAGLTARDRVLVALRFHDDLSASQIANLLGYPTPFHVYRHLNRLLAQLKDDLRRRGVRGSAS